MKRIDPYDVLGVKRDADPETIKAAYRNAAKAHHPDKGGDADRFAAATLAYDVLMDEKRRKLFDETGKIDDGPVEAKQQRAKQLLYEMIAHALMGDADPLSINLISQMDQLLQKQIGEIATRKGQLNRALDRAKRMEIRFSRKAKKETENTFVDMLKRHQQQIADGLEFNESEAEIRQIALDMVRLYTYAPTAPGKWQQVNAFTIQHPFGGLGGTGTGF